MPFAYRGSELIGEILLYAILIQRGNRGPSDVQRALNVELLHFPPVALKAISDGTLTDVDPARCAVMPGDPDDIDTFARYGSQV